MNTKRIFSILTIVMLFALVMVGVVSADDGLMFRKNVSKTPDQETERANLMQMTFYVPAQSSDGTLLEGIDYYSGDGTVVETREYAKPLIAVFIDGLLEEHEEEIASILSGAGFGAHDAYAALSLDDGATWKRTNLSNSAELSSFVLKDGHEYPGDAHNMTFAIAGDKVLVGWISKYCDGGSPLYAFADDEIAAIQDEFGLPDLYVHDIWGVAGDQKSVDYTFQGFPEVGEIPYSCVWSARGQLLEDPDTSLYDIIWTKAERLTSGRRDANRLEMNGDSAAGFMMTWQEDPEGLRPGQGLGPGEGWSGAVVNQQTDLWYSFISWDDFDQVDLDGDLSTVDPVSLVEYDGGTIPKPAVPMAMPIRLTDNKMCKQTGSDLYCYVDFDDENPWLTELPDDLSTIAQSSSSTFCTAIEPWTTPSGTTTLQLCQAEDGRVLGGRVGASRPRVNVQPYNSLFILDDTDDDTWYDSGIVIMGAEESKALGEGNTGDDVEPEDIGKNMWYYSFDLLNPSFVMQGGMLNQPAVNPETLTFFDQLEDDFGNLFYETEIARRFSHFSQPIHQFGDSGVSAVLIVKQGIINQGGPADIFLRMTEVDTDLLFDCELDGDETTTEQCLPEGENPYAYQNLVCDEWDYTDGSNPRYLEGLCLSNMINVSGGTIVACDGVEGDCAADFPWDGGETFSKVTKWVQTEDNLDDQSWENPYDVAKGHRGFIDGDFIMMMYAWSPNWKANSVGNDHYNLYARRSFDGGLSWTTTPADMGGTGTTTCENYGAGSDYDRVCTTYGAGEFEQAHNLSQLIGNKVTILDPRYSPSGGIKMLDVNTDLTGIDPAYDDDIRDPSKYFIVYETGDNTTVAEGEAVPLDLFYSRATVYGDFYDLVTPGTDEECVESVDVVCTWDWLEHDREDLSGEAADLANPGGTLFYAIWNQWQEDEYENVSNSDAIFRRVMYLDDVDADAVATISYVSDYYLDISEFDKVRFKGWARDYDHLGEGAQIINYMWFDEQGAIRCSQEVNDDDEFTDPCPLNKVGVCKCTDEIGVVWDPGMGLWKVTSGPDFICDNDQVLVYECTNESEVLAESLGSGKHTMNFRAMDNEGNWSRADSVDIFVFTELNQVFLPVAMP